MWFRAVGALCGGVLLMVCAPASAWTSAQVEDVRARVVLTPQGDAKVLLDLGIDVRGGWLERFDLEGLSPELRLDPDRPGWLTTAEGSVVAARVTTHEGAVTVRFDKRDAARRGLHRLFIAYRAPLSEASDAQQSTFALPGFQQAIDEAEIVVDAPNGVRAVRDPESTTEVRERGEGERVEISFRRTHWPRETPWLVELEGRAPSGRGALGRRLPPRAFSSGCGISLFVLATGALARASFRRRARRLGLATEPWRRFRIHNNWLIAFVAIVGAALWPFSVELAMCSWFGLSLVFAERALPSCAALRLSSVTSSDATWLRKARRAYWLQVLGLAPWVDAFTFAGLLGMSALLLAPSILPHGRLGSVDPWALGILCALPAWITSSRLRLPRSPAERVRRLLAAAVRLRVEGCALRLVSYVDAKGDSVDTRMRVTPASRYAGLLRVDLCADSRRMVPGLSMSVVVRKGSPADRWLALHFAESERSLSTGGLRVAYRRSVGDAGSALDDLFAYLSRESQSLVTKRDVEKRAA